ncbi:glycosyltransferase family 4 protein [Plastoroseomonas hellenica]|uniref:glycosyltransferase family 4 protein n=1 Tax=Plastoroseomonas hellenica TaxID=2687306 RepID=UPI001BAD17D4|nr:glycosyltransferase family 4 protein [Plastoroseomonas hellenica]MBR0647783.1 glycosyltransferase family 4 protein [Plastoroseomonas hellenica]
MRPLLWYWGRRGGGAQFALCLAQAMAPAGLALSVSRQGSLIEAFRAVAAPRQEVDTYASLGGFLRGLARVPSLTRQLRRFAQAEGADVVISAMAHPWTPLIAPALTRAGLRYVPVVHDALPHPGDPAPLMRWRLDRELACASAAVALSETVAAAIAARFPRLPLIHLPLGAHLPFGATAATETRFDFLFFGRIRAYKGLDLLRDAWAIVAAARPEATLRVVGDGNLDAVAPGLAALPGVTIEQRWVPDEEMAGIVSAAGALVLPYREASQSGVLPIALALGVPAVATTVGGLGEQLRDEVTGLQVAPEPRAFAGAMLRMLDPERRARLAAGAKAAGAVLTDWDRQAAALRKGIAAALRASVP